MSMLALECSLVQQTIEAIKSRFIQATCNHQTGQYASSIHGLIQYLFSTNENITPTDLDMKAEQVKKLMILLPPLIPTSMK